MGFLLSPSNNSRYNQHFWVLPSSVSSWKRGPPWTRRLGLENVLTCALCFPLTFDISLTKDYGYVRSRKNAAVFQWHQCAWLSLVLWQLVQDIILTRKYQIRAEQPTEVFGWERDQPKFIRVIIWCFRTRLEKRPDKTWVVNSWALSSSLWICKDRQRTVK